VGKNNQRIRKLAWVSFSVAGLLGATAVGAGAGGGAGDGSGTGSFTVKLSPGVSKRQTLQVLPSGAVRATRNLGVGNEHAIVQMLGNVAVVLYSSSNVDAATRGPSAIKCSSVQLNANGPPTILADQIQLTSSNSDRLGHPAVACDPTAGKCLVAYGANNVNGNGNTQTYATVVDQNCKDLAGGMANHVVLNADPNNNEAAPFTVFDGKKFVFGYYSNGRAEYGELVTIQDAGNGQFLPQQLTDPQRLTPSNIGRPSIVALSDTRALFAAPRGNERPSEGGNEVRMLNTDVNAIVNNNGTRSMPTLWTKILVTAKPDPNNIGGVDGLPGPLGGNGIYPGQPILALGQSGEVYLSSVISNGAGRNRNKKGSSTHQLLVFAPTDTGPNVITSQVGLASESSHATLCSGLSGTTDAPVHTAAIYTAPITGFGASSMALIQHAAGTLSPTVTMAVSSDNADSGYLSNMLGRNPATQGRDHLRCLGDVPNPSYGVQNGFMPKVKSFFLTPWAGRVAMDPATAPKVNGLPEDRNALYLTLVAAVHDKDQPIPAPASPGTPGDPGAGPTDPGATGTPGTPGTPGTAGTPGTPGHYTGGCAVAFGAQPAGGTALLLVLLGALALAVTSRRKRS
jgi:hypothetical protein